MVQKAPETESAYEALKDFIGKFDSRQVREEDKVPPSTDPHEREYGGKHRKEVSRNRTMILPSSWYNNQMEGNNS